MAAFYRHVLRVKLCWLPPMKGKKQEIQSRQSSIDKITITLDFNTLHQWNRKEVNVHSWFRSEHNMEKEKQYSDQRANGNEIYLFGCICCWCWLLLWWQRFVFTVYQVCVCISSGWLCLSVRFSVKSTTTNSRRCDKSWWINWNKTIRKCTQRFYTEFKNNNKNYINKNQTCCCCCGCRSIVMWMRERESKE